MHGLVLFQIASNDIYLEHADDTISLFADFIYDVTCTFKENLDKSKNCFVPKSELTM